MRKPSLSMNDIKNNQMHFKSLNHPIKPFKLKAGNDIIKFKEIDYTQKPSKELLVDTFTFFLDNFANQSSHPYWKKCRKHTETFERKTYINKIISEINHFKKALKNPDTTLMIGRNKDNKISAAIFATPLNLTPIVKNNNTLYIDSIAVNKEYRGYNIGKNLLENVIKSTNDRYNDVFLVAYKESEPFYTKQGFKTLKNRGANQSNYIENLASERIDYPKYASFLNRPINKNKQRWYNKDLPTN